MKRIQLFLIIIVMGLFIGSFFILQRGMDVIMDRSINFNKIHYILLVSYSRAGSSHVGDLLQQMDGSFYSIEPTLFLNGDDLFDPDMQEQALDFLSNVYSCSSSLDSNYANYICNFGDEARKELKHSRSLWESCDHNKTICCQPGYIDYICSQSNYRIIKITRLSLASAIKLSKILPGSVDFKILYMVRDPRSLYVPIDLDNPIDCPAGAFCDIDQMCNDLKDEIETYSKIVETKGEKIHVVRFEDIAVSPFMKVEAIYSSLGVPFTPNAINFINQKTEKGNKSINNPFVDERDQKRVITGWTGKLNGKDVDEIQSSCEFVFQKLGYKPIVLSEVANSTDSSIYDFFNKSYDLLNRL